MSVLFLCFLLKLATFHPVHVSYTSVDINQQTGEISVVHKFFSDDLRLLFYHLYERDIILDPLKEIRPEDQATIKTYLSNSFIIATGHDKTIKFEFVEKEQNEEFVWLHFKGRMTGSAAGKITITNTLLLDLYEDQTNLVILSTTLADQGIRFDYMNRERIIDLN